MLRTLTHKILLVALVFLFLIALLAIFTFSDSQHNRVTTVHLSDHLIDRAKLTSRFNASLERTIDEAVTYARVRQADDRLESLEALEQARAEAVALDKLEAQLDASEPQLQTLFDDIANRRRVLLRTAQQSLHVLFQERPGNVTPSAERQISQLENDMGALAAESQALLRHDVTALSMVINERMVRGMYGSGAVFVLFGMLILIALFATRRWITQPIKLLTKVAAAVAKGNVDHEVKTTSNDEIGELQRAFRQMLTTLNQQQALRKTFEEELAHVAHHDPLSNLPNRAAFMNYLQQALGRAESNNTSLAVMVLDLDNFKVVNESLGHEVGDRLLISVAQRLRACVRPTDTVARLGGDEFTVLLEGISAKDAVRAAERIHANLQAPVILDNHEVFANTSIGIALSSPGRSRPESLLRDADVAMYRAKAKGKASYAVFDESMSAAALERLELEADLRRALERDEFQVFYQPVVLLNSGEITGVEALVRWQHPERGLIAPAMFIPLAEETGLIIPLGLWVLETACRQLRSWQNQFPESRHLGLSVNLSARQFQHPTLLGDIARTLDETGFDPHLLALEITESIVMENGESTLQVLRELKGLGIQLAIDDFGTGYSSLAYLKRFPITTLKIDRSFVDRLDQDPEDTAIVRAIVTLAQALNLVVIGEGIETHQQSTHLRSLGCWRGQGYHFAKPMPADAIADLLTEVGGTQAATDSAELQPIPL